MTEKKICRCCITSSRHQMISLCSPLKSSKGIVLQIQPIIGISVLKSSNWPNHICKKCANKLEQLAEFHNMVTSSQKRLIDKFGEMRFEENSTNDKLIENRESKVLEQDCFDGFSLKASDDHRYEESLEDDNISADDLPNERHSDEIKPNLKEIEGILENIECSTISSKPIRKSKHKTSEMDVMISSFMKLECTICSIDPFSSFSALQAHFLKLHNTLGYVQCCENKFKRRDRLYEHILFHKDPEIFKCGICGKSFASRDKLSLHKMVHLPEESKRFKCPECNAKYATKLRLKRHLLVHVPEESKTYKCQDCDKRFSTNFFLSQHFRNVHSNNRRYVCEICAKKFMGLKALEKHQAVHEPPGSHARVKCEHCGKSYANESTLKKHMVRINDTKSVYQCDECNHISPNLIALRAHKGYLHRKDVIMHTCNVCNKSFRKKTNLVEHMAGHTGEKLYTCSFCPKQFNSNANKYSHQKKIHPEEWTELTRKRLYKN